MKISLTAFLIIFCLASYAQSPGLTINLFMDPVKARTIRYTIEMKICEPRKMTDKGDWFARDTSAIDFTALEPADIHCGEYFANGMPMPVSGNEEEKVFNHFRFSNQVFAWEKIMVFRISDRTSAKSYPAMYIVIPVRYKSFITTMDIKDVAFQPGRLIFLPDIKGKYDQKKLSFTRSLKKVKTIEVKNFALKGLL